MSHIVSIQTEVRDPVAIRAACDRLKLSAPAYGTTQLFSSSATGWAVQLPDWQYPVVCDVTNAKIAFDNYNGRWGDEQQLHKFLQAYAVEKVKIEARRQGQTAIEQPLADGSIRVQIAVAGCHVACGPFFHPPGSSHAQSPPPDH